MVPHTLVSLISLDPLVLLLDEPTSGLDSTTAVELLQLLHRLARGDGANETPKTVITSIHQRTFFCAILSVVAASGTIFFSPLPHNIFCPLYSEFRCLPLL